MRLVLAVGAAVVVAAAWGCGSDDTNGSGGGAGGTAGAGAGGAAGVGAGGVAGTDAGASGPPKAWIDGCTEDAKNLCGKYFECYPVAGPYLWGTQADCQTALSANCVKQWRNIITPEEASACAAAQDLPNLSCTEFDSKLNNGPAWPNLPAQCQFKGDKAVDEPCEFGPECASGFCGNTGPTHLCGACISPGTEGQPCAAGGICDFGLACAASTSKCVKLAQLDDPCSAAAPCAAGYVCTSGKCVAQGALDDPCDPGAIGFPCDSDMLCNPVSHVCESGTPLAAVGEPCWVLSDDTISLCDDAWCQVDVYTGKGTCIAKKAEGEACTLATNLMLGRSDCAAPFQCIDGTCQYRGDVFACP